MAAVKLQVPSWVEEIASPKELFIDSLISAILAKVHEYKSEESYYSRKYRMPFLKFEKKVKALKQEDFQMYDDYILWKAANILFKKWLSRYNSIAARS